MSKTKEILNKLSDTMYLHINQIKSEYAKDGNIANYKHIVRRGAIDYLTGLQHAGIITETEKRALFSYITL